MKRRPKISVIIPTYYRNELLVEAIESVLRQEYEPVELIVVDDSGEGHAEPILNQYDDVTGIIKETNGGCVAARRNGVQSSTGEYVHFLDDDDLFLEGKLSKTVEILENNPEAGVAFSGVKQDNGWQCAPSPEMSGDVLEETLRFETFPCWTGSMLIERRLLTDIMPLPQLPAANDSLLMIELAQRTRFDYVDEYLVYNRREESEIWTGLNKIEGMRQLLDIKKTLYDQYPKLRRDVRTEINFQEGAIRLNDGLWDSRAIACFAKATYYASEERLKYGGALAASLFGRPGFRTAARIRNGLTES